MIDQETVVNRLLVLINDIRACDERVEDSKIVEKVMQTLASQFDHILFVHQLVEMFTKSLHVAHFQVDISKLGLFNPYAQLKKDDTDIVNIFCHLLCLWFSIFLLLLFF